MEPGKHEGFAVGIMPDVWIREQAKKGMIEPFEASQVRQHAVCPDCGKRPEFNAPVTRCKFCDRLTHSPKWKRLISYGTSSYGYDIRVADEFKIFVNSFGTTVVDPKNFDPKCFHEIKGVEHCIIPPNSFALCRSVEHFKIPDDVLCVVLGKSTYARCGIVCNVTPLEPGWEGYITIEISNTTPLPAKIYANEGIAQVLFYKSGLKCETTYADRSGKYQNQKAEIVEAKV